MIFFERLFVIVTVSLFWHNTHAQFFTGEIKYKTTLTAKNDSFNIEDIDRIATNDEYRYKITSAYYKTSYFKAGVPTYSYTYHGDSKRMYDEQTKDDYISYRDSRRYDVPLLGFQVDRDSTITHLGRECFLVKEEHPNYTSYSFYAEDLKFDFESFKEHKVGNWYETSKLLNGRIALKTINDYPEYTEVIEVTEIIPREVSSSEFDLPQNKPIYASYQALDTQVSMMQVSQENFDCYSNKKGAAPIPSDGTTKYTSYVEMVVLKDGSLKVLGSLEEDPHGLYKVAIDIAKSCGFQFSAGKIGDEQVDSITYLPIEFSF